mgnify:CR=1 FL=1
MDARALGAYTLMGQFEFNTTILLVPVIMLLQTMFVAGIAMIVNSAVSIPAMARRNSSRRAQETRFRGMAQRARLKPSHIFLIVGFGLAVVTAASGIIAALVGAHDDSPVTREVFLPNIGVTLTNAPRDNAIGGYYG